MNKCTMVFILGAAVSLTASAFFWVPGNMFNQAKQVMMPPQQQSQCDCSCIKEK
jgi:hypothetical protein